MKKFLFPGLFLLCSFCFSQESFNYMEEVNRMYSAPNSPGAQAFSGYGDIRVNLLVGAPNVSIPLYTHTGREISLPLSLTYDINARKVQDIASSVGMGWNLNLGGRISRIVNGQPDDYFATWGYPYKTLLNDIATRTEFLEHKNDFFNHNVGAFPPTIEFSDVADAEDYFEFLYDNEQGKIDISLDNFSLDVMGISDHIILDDENSVAALSINNPRLKVEYLFNGSIQQWIVTDESGVKYTFAEKEQTKSQNYDDGNGNGATNTFRVEYNSSWLLTQVESPTGKDVYTFEYVNSGYWPQPFFTNSIHVINNGASQYRTEYDPQNRYYLNQHFLSRVKHNNKTIIDIGLMPIREDLDIANSGIESITIKDPIDGNVINHFQFDHSYFGNSNGSMDEKRLKLDGVRIAGKDYDTNNSSYDYKKHYSFVYDREQDMPAKTSFSQDILGYYNGVDNTFINDPYGNPPDYRPLLFPQQIVDLGSGQSVTFSGADRSFHADKAQIGILKEIHYPTEGYSKFDYEPHNTQEYVDIVQIQNVGVAYAISGHATTSVPPECGGEVVIGTNTFTISDNQNKTYDIKFKVINRGSEDTDYKAYLIYSGTANFGPQYTYEGICNGDVQPLYEFDQANPFQDEVTISNVNLSNGYYMLIAVNLDPGTPGCVSQNANCAQSRLQVVEKVVTGQQLEITEYPGLRTKSISNYTSASNLATKKVYDYSELVENYEPKLMYSTDSYGFDANGQVVSSTIHHRLTHAIGGSQPYITYGTVTEKQVNFSDVAVNGYAVNHFFNNPSDYKGSVTQPTSPFATDYYGNIEKGNIKRQEVYNSDDELLSKDEYFYMPINGTIFKGTATKDYDENSLNFIQLYSAVNQSGNSVVKFRFLLGQESNTGSIDPPSSSNCAAGDGIKCLSSGVNSRTIPFYTYTRTQYPQHTQMTNTQYLGNLELSNTTKTTFAPEIGYLPREKSTSTSQDNKILITEYKYPQDLLSEPNMQQLTDDHRRAVTAEVLTYQKMNDSQKELLGTKKTTFDIFNGSIFAKQVLVSKLDEPLEPRMTYRDYDDGNLVEVARVNDIPTLYIWGYDGLFPVAKIEGNLSYTLDLPPSLVNQIKTATHANLPGKLQLLREHADLEDALVTTYTYLPNIGIETVTDPRGNKVTYEYDELNRLKYVIDQNGNRLSESEYNYRINH